MSDLPHYRGWSTVPAHLLTATQLKSLDLPRRPGPPAATVEGGDYRGKSDVFELYNLADSPPTSATAATLDAAAARRTFGACTSCAARPDTGLSQITGRCETCLHVEKLLKAQLQAQQQREGFRSWAADRLNDPKTLVAWIDEHTPPPSPSGRQRKPVAHTLTILTTLGHPVLRICHRLPGIGPRVRAVPENALAHEQAAAAVTELGERFYITWTHTALWRVVYMSTGRSLSYLAPHGAEMNFRIAGWRGDIDPRTGRQRAAIPPGNADRLALLLRRMADGQPPEPTTTGQA